jgi:hypothetical protein
MSWLPKAAWKLGDQRTTNEKKEALRLNKKNSLTLEFGA